MTAETAPTIKHCPYCGSLAEFEYDDISDQSGDDVPGKVECIRCRASIKGHLDDAVKKWNSRAHAELVVGVQCTDALKTMLASEMHRQVATFYANSLKPISLDTSGPQPCKNLVYPDVQKDSLIDALLEVSGHGTEREDIVRAFEAGVKFASPDVTFFGPETDFDD